MENRVIYYGLFVISLLTLIGVLYSMRSTYKDKTALIKSQNTYQKTEIASTSLSAASMADTNKDKETPPTNTYQSTYNSSVWETYTNKELGIEAIHPKDWKIDVITNTKTGEVLSFSFNAPNSTTTKIERGSIQFFVQKNKNSSRLSIYEWYENEMTPQVKKSLEKNKEITDFAIQNTIIDNEPAVLLEVTLKEGKKRYMLYSAVNGTDILTISYNSQKELDQTYLRILSKIKLNTGLFGIISFADNSNKASSSYLPLVWHIKLSPDDAKNYSFQIVSELKEPQPSTNLTSDLSLLLTTLADKIEIQHQAGDLVNLQFFLNPKPQVDQKNKDILIFTAGFTRLNEIQTDDITTQGSKPYATSFPINMLGNKLENITLNKMGTFDNIRLPIATVTTSDDTKTYTYEITLKRWLR